MAQAQAAEINSPLLQFSPEERCQKPTISSPRVELVCSEPVCGYQHQTSGRWRLEGPLWSHAVHDRRGEIDVEDRAEEDQVGDQAQRQQQAPHGG